MTMNPLTPFGQTMTSIAAQLPQFLLFLKKTREAHAVCPFRLGQAAFFIFHPKREGSSMQPSFEAEFDRLA